MSILWSFVNILPYRFLEKLVLPVSNFFYKLNPKFVQQYRKNLNVFVDKNVLENEVKKGVYKNCKFYFEAFTFSKYYKNINKFIEFSGIEKVLQELKKGKGVAIALTHSGNQDFAAAYLGKFHDKNVSVAEHLKDEKFFQKFISIRKKAKIKIIPHDDRPVLDKLLNYVKKGYVAPLISERNMSKKGVPSKFFGQKILASAGPALISIKANVNLYPVHIYYCDKDKKYKGKVFDNVYKKGDSVEKLTQKWLSVLEKEIVKHPSDWHMFQKIFV